MTLSEVADLLDEVVQIGSLFRLRTGFSPNPGSPAENDGSNPRFGDLASEVHVYAGMILSVVDDHLSALGKVVRQ